MRKKMNLKDLTTSKELKAIDAAWYEYVRESYNALFRAPESVSEGFNERMDASRELYFEKRKEIRDRFSNRNYVSDKSVAIVTSLEGCTVTAVDSDVES
jgi:hypothetical protein